MAIRRGTAIALCMALVGQAWAADRDLSRSKPQTAQVVTLARLTAVLCPEVDVDEAAVHALMGHAGITDEDIVNPGTFGAGDTVVARSFAASVFAGPKDACATAVSAFGSGERQLLHRAGKPI